MMDGLSREHFLVLIAIDVACEPTALVKCMSYFQHMIGLHPAAIAKVAGIQGRDILVKLSARPQCDSLLSLLALEPSSN
jgi:hypothetical protein